MVKKQMESAKRKRCVDASPSKKSKNSVLMLSYVMMSVKIPRNVASAHTVDLPLVIWQCSKRKSFGSTIGAFVMVAVHASDFVLDILRTVSA